MKKIALTLFVNLCAFTAFLEAQIPSQQVSSSAAHEKKENKKTDEEILYFTPPKGWLSVDPSALSGHMRILVVGKGNSALPPSMNLTSQPYSGSLKQYLKIVKNMNQSQGYEWKDLGMIQTQAGPANLSQVDTIDQYGTTRLMHVILKKNGQIYIITARAAKEEFSVFYKDFFAAMRSIKIVKSPYDLVSDVKQRTQLKNEADKIQREWIAAVEKKKNENPQLSLLEAKESVFNSEKFQNTVWAPFKETVKQKYAQMGPEWGSLFLHYLEDQLFI